MGIFTCVAKLFSRLGSKRIEQPFQVSAEMVAHFIKINGIYMIDDSLLARFPQLANCRKGDGIATLSSAALAGLYTLVHWDCYKDGRYEKLQKVLEIDYPEIDNALTRAMLFFNHYSFEKGAGLIQIAGSEEVAYLFIMTNWLITELTLSDDYPSREMYDAVSNVFVTWYRRIPEISP